MSQERLSFLVLRLGLAFCFIYAAIAAQINPENWVGYFPTFVQNILPVNILLVAWGSVEIILALWLLWGKHIFFPSLLLGLSLLGVVFLNWGELDILFRDISLALVCLSLSIATYRR